MSNVIRYLKKRGIKHTFSVIYKYKIDKIIQVVLSIPFKQAVLQDIILIESHNDFDCNGGALYQYLVENGYNKRYKIVWLIKHIDDIPSNLPINVECVPAYRPSIKKNYYKWVAKYLSYDQDCEKKLRKDQIQLFMNHGTVGLKDCTGLMILPDNLNYCLTASEWWLPIDAKMFLMQPNDNRLKICGFPVQDVFYNNTEGDLKKLHLQKHYNKVVLWMPTFRQSETRNDCEINYSIGIPLIESIQEYEEINDYLNSLGIFLIIKIHPKQDLSNLKIRDRSNIKVLTGYDVKKLKIDNYRLMKDVDAMISDYSSAAYDFLHANKPIAYDFSDIDSYKLGIVVEDPMEMIAGHIIKSVTDMKQFLYEVSNNRDIYYCERQELSKKVFKYHDGNSAKRVVELLGLDGK